MSWFTRTGRVFAGSILAGLMGTTLMGQAVEQQTAAPPDFSSNLVGWVGFNGGGPGPDERVDDAPSRERFDDPSRGFGMHAGGIGVKPMGERKLRVRIDGETVPQRRRQRGIAGQATAAARPAQASFATAHRVC